MMVYYLRVIRLSELSGLFLHNISFSRPLSYNIHSQSLLKNKSVHGHRNRGTFSPNLNDLNIESDVRDRIIYNSNMHNRSFIQTKKIEKAETRKKVEDKAVQKPIILNYFIDVNNKLNDENEKSDDNSKAKEIINMPLSIKVRPIEILDIEPRTDYSESSYSEEADENLDHICNFELKGRKWMNDYEKYNERDLKTDNFEEWQLDYGTPNISVPVSKVPCGGCGALLHCQDSSIPGYLPYEIFKECSEKDLRCITCQRCHFMTQYNTALSVAVDRDVYPNIISKIQREKALILLMVDLTDFPCSVWPGILDIIGKKRPVFIVGNKVDLLWGDKKDWMERTKELLKSTLPAEMNIKHICLISAKTGFGIEELINKLHTLWGYKGDVYLVGCTNVGKSSLFNALLQSDYCKVKMVELIQRATIAPWPGTTINLLKFPILRPEGWRLYLRAKRLIMNRETLRTEVALKKEQMKAERTKLKEPPQLIGHIGRTFRNQLMQEEVDDEDSFSMPNRKQMRTLSNPGSGLNPNDPDLVHSKWLYDTPGVLHHDQFLDLLTTEELALTLPKNIIKPRTFKVKPGWSLFIGGIARLDYVEGEQSAKLTVFSSQDLPITICTIDDSEHVYNALIGTDYMAVPKGKGIRLKKWPYLEQGDIVKVSGISNEESSIDVVLSSAGWIAVTPSTKSFCKFLPWTPNARGIHLRQPPLLPYAVSLRGKKINKRPSYGRTRPLTL